VMTSLTSSAVMMGLVNFVSGIPMLTLTLVGGLVADWLDRRRILIATQVLQIFLAATLGWLVARDLVRVWHIVAVAFLLGVSAAFEMPAAAALVPELVPRNEVAAAIAVDRSIFHGTRLIGPALGGYAVARFGAASAFFLNALSFFALIIALLTIRIRPAQGAEEKKALGGIREGLEYVRSDPLTLGMIALMASATLFLFPVMAVMLPLYARQELNLGADRMGFLMGISGLGSFTGSVGLLAIPKPKRRKLMLCAVGLASTALGVLALARVFPVAAGSIAALTLGSSLMIGLANTVIQERAPSQIRGRVSSVAGLSFFGLMPFASLGVTSMADIIGMRVSLLLAAALFLLTGTLILLIARDQTSIPGVNHHNLRSNPASLK
ncbi:MAG: MFS transporter, partial [Verrucomicrobiae bacterium]|nr:MFS transporter [Verrucomicrobiae bacterium]